MEQDHSKLLYLPHTLPAVDSAHIKIQHGVLFNKINKVIYLWLYITHHAGAFNQCQDSLWVCVKQKPASTIYFGPGINIPGPVMFNSHLVKHDWFSVGFKGSLMSWWPDSGCIKVYFHSLAHTAVNLCCMCLDSPQNSGSQSRDSEAQARICAEFLVFFFIILDTTRHHKLYIL